MNKKEAIQLLHNEGWTKVDAQRALETIDFKSDSDLEEITIRRVASQFAGSELIKRQNLQRAQKGLVTKRNKQIEDYLARIEELKKKSDDLELEAKIQELIKENQKLIKVNNLLKKDNKDLKNVVDAIRLRLTIETKHILKLDNIKGIKQSLFKLLKSTLG